MAEAILTLNAGSSSIKVAIFARSEKGLEPDAVFRGQVSGIGESARLDYSQAGVKARSKIDPDTDHAAATISLLDLIASGLGDIDIVAVGHRIVHGGVNFTQPVFLDEGTIEALHALTPLAPHHQPHNLAGIATVRKRWPSIPQIACFDTAFHRSQPEIARQFGLPIAMYREGIQRYGFHGLSYDFIASKIVDLRLNNGAVPRRVIVAHLGAGASMCAMLDGRSHATTMGFTALDGLPMATRCGDLDPGVILYLLEEKRMSMQEVNQCLYRQSGLLGLSAISGDMRILADSNDPAARAAIDYFVYRCVREIGSLAAAIGGVDVLVFTAGIGENAHAIRAAILDDCSWLGFRLDREANLRGAGRITPERPGPSAWVLRTDEELVIAEYAHQLVAVLLQIAQ